MVTTWPRSSMRSTPSLSSRGKPSVLVADTVKGKGVSFMEDSLLWHYRCPDLKEYEAAMRELGDA